MIDPFVLSFITAICIGGAAGYLGSLLVTKRMALVGDALGHVALPGIGLALLLGIDVSLGAFVFLFLGIFLVWLFGNRTVLPTEALVGVVFVASLAVGFLLLPEKDLEGALIGDISSVGFLAATVTVFLSVFVFWMLHRMYKDIVLSGVSEDLASVQRINIKKQNFIFLILVSIIVALGIKVTGSLLAGALVIIPAAASRNFSKNLGQYSFYSVFLGMFGAGVGIFLFKVFGFPAGPAIILTSVLFFLFSLIFKKS